MSNPSSPSPRQMTNITLAQLKQLADGFGFDFQKAKDFLKIEGPQAKRGPRAKAQPNKVEGAVSRIEANRASKPYDGTTIPPITSLKEMIRSPVESNPKTGRSGKTGYHYYLQEISGKVKREMHGRAQLTGEKVPRTAVVVEIGRRWHALTDAKRRAWNDYARAQQA